MMRKQWEIEVEGQRAHDAAARKSELKKEREVKPMTRREKMLAQIQRHSENLMILFPNAKKRGVELCKALHRLEMQGQRYALLLCNGDIGKDENREDALLSNVRDLLGKGPEIVFNLDPRGYAFKIDSESMGERRFDLHRDLGGNGIVCPEFKEG